MASRVLLLCILLTVGFSTVAVLAGDAGPIQVSLRFTSEPSDVVAWGRGQKGLSLSCGAELLSSASDPQSPLRFTWTKDGVELQLANDSRRQILPNGTLYFQKVLLKKVKGSDLGEYRCLVSNGSGTLRSRAATIRAAVLARSFSEEPETTTVVRGGTVFFPCTIDALPEALLVWRRDGLPLPLDERYIKMSGTLFILGAQPEDEGQYSCVATNPLTRKQRVSREAQLTVDEYPNSIPTRNLWLSTRRIRIPRGHNASIGCVAPNMWPLPKLAWVRVQLYTPASSPAPSVSSTTSSPLKNLPQDYNTPSTVLPLLRDAPDSPSQEPGFSAELPLTVTETGLVILELNNIQPSDSGNYSCLVIGGESPLAQTLSVEVLEPPVFTRRPESQRSPSARTVRFECNATGEPPPTITWLKDGKILQNNGHMKQRPDSLVLLTTVSEDEGIYQCIAHNVLGEVSTSAQLTLNATNLPKPPLAPECESTEPGQILLRWNHTGVGIQAYTVHYAVANSNLVENQVVSRDRTLIVDKLRTYTNYTFKIRAYAMSASDFSESIICQTAEEEPFGAPEIIKVEPTSFTSARVEWLPLSQEKARGLVIGYKIQWQRELSPSASVDTVSADIFDYTIRGLEPEARYKVRILAGNSKGWLNSSLEDKMPWKLFEMPSSEEESKALPAAPEVQLTSINSSSIEVNLIPDQDPTTEIFGYKIYYRGPDERLIGPILLTNNATSTIIPNLIPGTTYAVLVSGCNNDGEGESSTSFIKTLVTEETSNAAINISSSGPQPPIRLEAWPASSHAINVTWQPPPGSNKVVAYTVCYGPVQQLTKNIDDGTQQSSLKYLRSIGTSALLDDLKPYTLYEIKVRAHDSNDEEGPYSQKVECYTMEGVPGAVRDVQWQLLNSSAVRISWREPSQNPGPVSSYHVTITTHSGVKYDHDSTMVPGTQTFLDLSGLEKNILYLIQIRGTSRSGQGPTSQPLVVTISAPQRPLSKIDKGRSSGEQAALPGRVEHDQTLGIVLGASIGLVCIILCIAFLFWRRQCAKRSTAALAAAAAAASVNGNGSIWRDSGEIHELEPLPDSASATGVSTHIPTDVMLHLDTKGGYPNGQTSNGLLSRPLLSNGRIPNGHAGRDKIVSAAVHITENPQYRATRGNSISSDCSESGSRCGVIKRESDSGLGHREPLLDSSAKSSADGDCIGDDDSDELDCTALTSWSAPFPTSPAPVANSAQVRAFVTPPTRA